MLILDYVNEKFLHFGSFSASTSTHFLSLPCPNHRVAAQKVVSLIQIDARILKVPPFSSALNIWGHFSLLPVWYFFKHVGKTNTGFIHIKITYYPWQSLRCIPSRVQVQFPHVSTSSWLPSLLHTGYCCSDVASAAFVRAKTPNQGHPSHSIILAQAELKLPFQILLI